MARRKLLHRLLYGKNTTFRNYESACLEAVRGRLSPSAQEVLDRQLAALENIQRFSDDRMTAVHMAAPPESDLFADTRSELRIAKIKLLDPEKPALIATLVLDHGRISSLEFRRSPRHLRTTDAQVSDVEILTDPMSTDRPEPAGVDRLVRISGDEIAAQEVLPPRSSDEVEKDLKTIDAPTPDDYGELLKLTDRFVLGEWRFLGTASRTLGLDEILVVAAERLDGEEALCFRADASTSEVIAYDEIANDSIASYPSFIQALVDVAKSESLLQPAANNLRTGPPETTRSELGQPTVDLPDVQRIRHTARTDLNSSPTTEDRGVPGSSPGLAIRKPPVFGRDGGPPPQVPRTR